MTIATDPIDNLIELLAMPPYRAVWQCDNNLLTTAGSCYLVQVLPDRVEATLTLQPQMHVDEATMLGRILVAMRPYWPDATDWLAQQMNAAGRLERGVYAGPCGSERCAFVWYAERRQAQLIVRRD